MSELNIDKSKVVSAVGVLAQVVEKSQKKQTLLEESEVVQLQVSVKKIPPKDKTIKLKLPHSIRHSDLEVCLFVKDLDKRDRDYEPTVNHFSDILRKRGISCVTNIIPLKSLKTEYKPYEAKRNLSCAYDVFLADARIIRFLPTYLGKHFYGKKKVPVQVNLQAKDLAKEINAAIDNSRCVIGSSGSCSTAVVGHIQMSQAELADNIMSASSQISAGVAGGVKNVRQLSIKTKQSLSIPIYLSGGGPQDVFIPKEARGGDVQAEEITTLFGAKVKVFPSGQIQVVREDESAEHSKTRKRPKTMKHSGKKKANGVKPTQAKKLKNK